jgi:hypothetical protein
LEAINPKGLNRIAKIGYGHLCPREENLRIHERIGKTLKLRVTHGRVYLGSTYNISLLNEQLEIEIGTSICDGCL